MDEDKIKKDAKKLLDKFAVALASVDKESIGKKGSSLKDEGQGVDRDDFEREEYSGSREPSKSDIDESSNEDFKDKILKNAPKSDGDFIVAEKRSWK